MNPTEDNKMADLNEDNTFMALKRVSYEEALHRVFMVASRYGLGENINSFYLGGTGWTWKEFSDEHARRNPE